MRILRLSWCKKETEKDRMMILKNRKVWVDYEYTDFRDKLYTFLEADAQNATKSDMN